VFQENKSLFMRSRRDKFYVLGEGGVWGDGGFSIKRIISQKKLPYVYVNGFYCDKSWTHKI